jgi:hypothetical protein
MKKIFIAFLFLSSFTYSQSNEITGLSVSDFETAKMLFIKMMESEDYKKKEDIQDELTPMLEGNGIEDVLNPRNQPSEEKLYKWFEENLPKEKAEKAIILFKKILELEEKMQNDNKLFFDFMKQATVEQKREILQPFFKKTREKLRQ